MLFQTSSRVAPFTMLVAAIAPGVDERRSSPGPPSAFWESSIETIELNRMPVASTPIVFAIASGP